MPCLLKINRFQQSQRSTVITDELLLLNVPARALWLEGSQNSHTRVGYITLCIVLQHRLPWWKDSSLCLALSAVKFYSYCVLSQGVTIQWRGRILHQSLYVDTSTLRVAQCKDEITHSSSIC